MSWMSVSILIFWLLCALNGFRRGMIKTAISMVFLILVCIMTAAISPSINTVLQDHTSLHSVVAEKCTKSLQERWNTEEGTSELPESLVAGLPLPESVKSLIEENSGIVGSVLGTDTVCKYVADYMATLIVYGIAILIALILSIIVLLIAAHFLNKLAELPGIGAINRVGGLLLGIVQGLLWIWIFFLIVTIMGGTDFGANTLKEIQRDNILTYLYNQNMIMDFVMNMIKGTAA